MNYLVLLTETTEAAAEGAQAGTNWASMIGMIAIYAVIIFAMWFFFMRPQKKEQKRVKEMLNSMDVGDCVLTTSGFYGIIIDISDDTVIVEFGNNRNCRIPMDKSAISKVEKADQGSGAESK
jgi:preprotein translocase subunit YajC